MRVVYQLLRCRRGASAAEFALVLPLLLILLLGMIDVGRFMYEVNQAEKATQVGARMAIVTDPVSEGLVEADFATDDLPAGELIPAGALGALKCDEGGCECTVDPCTNIGSDLNSEAFDAIVARMAQIKPGITNQNVEITYRGSGFGFAGGSSDDTMEISPLVTVSLKDVPFTPITSFMLANITLPSFATTMTAEDSAGVYSN